MNEDDMSPLERQKLERAKRIPKPNVPVKCKHCGSLKKFQRNTLNAIDFYWRYYRCKDCKQNYWCGVRHSDRLTVFTISTPKITRIATEAYMTGNLHNILTPGHPAVTAEYNQFTPSGKLPRNVLMARLEEEATAARNGEVSEPLDTTSSNEDDMKKTYPLPDTIKCLICGELDGAGSFLTSKGHSFHSGEWRWAMIKHLAPNCGKNFWFGTDMGYGTIKFYRNRPMEHGIISHTEECEQQTAQEDKLDKLQGELLNAATTSSNADDIATIYYDEFMPLIIEKNLTHLADEQIRQLFTRWLAVTYPNMKE